jgi:hypothetical protein
VAGGWRRHHYDELHNSYGSLRWKGHETTMGDMRNVDFGRKLEWKRPLGRPRH